MGVTKQFLRYSPASICNVIGSLNSNIVSTDPTTVAVGACENVYLWNLRTGDRVTELRGEKPVNVLQLSENGRLLAAGYADGNVRVFDRTAPTDEPVIVFSGHRTGVNCLAFSPDAIMLVSGGKDSLLIVWDLVNECGLFRLRGHKAAVTCVRFVRHARYIISSSKDSFVKFWDVAAKCCFYTLTYHKAEVYDFVLLRDDLRLLTASTELEIQIFSIDWLELGQKADSEQITTKIKRLRTESETQFDEEKPSTSPEPAEDEQQANTVLCCRRLGGVLRQSKGRATQLIASPDRVLLFALGVGPLVDIYRLYSEDEVEKRIQKKLRKARKRLAAEGNEGTDESALLEQVPKDVSTEIARIGQHKFEQKAKSLTVCRLVDSDAYQVTALLATNAVVSVRVELLKSGELVVSPLADVSAAGHRSDVRAIAFSNDDFAFASAAADGLKIWNRHSSACVRSCPLADACLALLFLPADRHAVAATKTGELVLFDLAAAQTLESVKAHAGAVWALAPSPDSKGFASASADKTVKFFSYGFVQIDDRKVISLSHKRTLELDEEVMCVRFSPNGKYVAVGLLDNTARVFFEDTLKFFLSLYGHSLPVLCLDISFDNELIITGSADKNVKIWGMDFGDCHKSLFAHDDSVTCVRFVSKTHLFFSAGKDGKVRQWDADKFERIQVLEGHTGEIWAMDVSSDGRYVVSASHDKSIRVWEKTDEILVIQEEQEMEREADYDKALTEKEDVIPGETAGEADIASKKSIHTVKSAENIIEAVEIRRAELAEADEPDLQTHPLLRALGSTNCDRFILDVIRQIRSSDLDKCLIMVPFGFVFDILNALSVCVDEGYKVELATRVILFLVRIHHHQMINAEAAVAILNKLRVSVPKKVGQLRDTIGFNTAALEYLQLDIQEAEDVHLFAEASERLKKRKKKQKQAFVLTVT